jgi:hypothetical protein
VDFQTTISLTIEFMKQNEIVQATIKDQAGSKATIKRDKHGFYNVSVTEQQQVRNV